MHLRAYIAPAPHMPVKLDNALSHLSNLQQLRNGKIIPALQIRLRVHWYCRDDLCEDPRCSPKIFELTPERNINKASLLAISQGIKGLEQRAAPKFRNMLECRTIQPLKGAQHLELRI